MQGLHRKNEPGFAFTSVAGSGDGVWRSIARFRCIKCPAVMDIPNAGGHSPEFYMKRARKQGWDITPNRPHHCLCPNCQGYTVKPKETVMPGANGVTTMASLAPPTPPATVPTKLPRDPTQDERMMIRDMLDKHFDDKEGCYLDGYSDQRIGEELNLPWAIVHRMREAAWGPIRLDPRVLKLEQTMIGLRGELEALAKRLAECDAMVADLRKRGPE